MKFLALCGSLRTHSLNRAVLRSAAEVCDPPRELTIDPGLGRLPFFNAEVEQTSLPPIVAEFRAAVGAVDGVLIATPEYAHGTSGVLKNALEWLVGGVELVGTPVALTSASPAPTGGERAQAWVRETLTIMGARVLPEGLKIPQAKGKVEDGRVTDEATLVAIKDLLGQLAAAAGDKRTVP